MTESTSHHETAAAFGGREIVQSVNNEADAFQVNFATDANNIFKELMSGRCIPGPLLANFADLCASHSQDKAAGTQALLQLGRTLGEAAESRNAQITADYGLTPGAHGLPELRPPAPPMPRSASEAPEQPPRLVRQVPLFVSERDIKREEPEDEVEDAEEVIPQPPIVPFEARRPEGKPTMVIRRDLPLYQPTEYDEDAVKSEMMGDGEFFDRQIEQRQLGLEYEQIARRGDCEERFILSRMGIAGYERRPFECIKCGVICANQPKYAAHMRYVHPKTREEREELVRQKAERAAQLMEEKKRKKETRTPTVDKMTSVEKEKKQPSKRSSIAVVLPNATVATPTTTPAAPVSDKIYVCPMCSEEKTSAKAFAAHMRYKHPRGEGESHKKRKATVKRKVEEEPQENNNNDSVATPIIATPAIDDALNTPTSLPSSAKPAKIPKIASTTTTPATGEYKCRICSRTFDDKKACAGHTGHCARQSTKGATPAPSLVPQQAAEEKDVKVEPEEEEPVEGVKQEEVMGEHDGEIEKQPRQYNCRICDRPFNNPSAVAGHTRHCMAAHGIDPSTSVMARRKSKARSSVFRSDATTPVVTAAEEPDVVAAEEPAPEEPQVAAVEENNAPVDTPAPIRQRPKRQKSVPARLRNTLND